MALIQIKLPEQKSNSGNDLLALISHEMKTPLHAILGLSEILLDESFGNLNAKQLSYLRGIYKHGQRLLDLIGDMLDFSKLKNGKAKLNPTEIGIYSFCEELKNSIAHFYNLKDVRLIVERNCSSDCFIADKSKMRQLVINLLSNAAKFSNKGSIVRLKIDEKDGDMVFEVHDNGTGINEYERDLIFNPFYQADSSNGRQFEGAGLGLTIARDNAVLHGGKIEVESKVGEGSTFRVLIPNKMSTSFIKSDTWNLFKDLDEADPAVLIMSGNSSASKEVVNVFRANGYRAVVISDSRALDLKINKLNPIAIVIDISHLKTDSQLFEMLSAIVSNQRSFSLPVYISCFNNDVCADPSELKAFDISIIDRFLESEETCDLNYLKQDKRSSKIIAEIRKAHVLGDGSDLISLINKYDFASSESDILAYTSFRRQLSKEISRSSRTKESLTLVCLELKELRKPKLNKFECELIEEIGIALRDHLRDYDLISKHHSGGFSIALPATDVNQRTAVVSKLKRVADELLTTKNLSYTSAFGFSTYPFESRSLGMLIRTAFDRLYGQR